MLHCWICGTVEWDVNDKLDNTTEFVTLLNMWGCWMKLVCWIKYNLWICYTIEIDENVKRDKIVEFVTLLNVWDCWMRYYCEIR